MVEIKIKNKINIQNMSKTKKIVMGFGTLALVLGIYGVFANQASAYRGDPSVKGPYYSAERHDAMEKAFDTNDYNAWKTLMNGRGNVTNVITKDNFAKFAQAHELALKGDLAGAQKIRAELGLGLRNGSGLGQGSGFSRGMHAGYNVNR